MRDEIRTVVTTDLSRLGRNYLQVGMYTEMIFPGKCVRYIAINDGVDSAPQETPAQPGGDRTRPEAEPRAEQEIPEPADQPGAALADRPACLSRRA